MLSYRNADGNMARESLGTPELKERKCEIR